MAKFKKLDLGTPDQQVAAVERILITTGLSGRGDAEAMAEILSKFQKTLLHDIVHGHVESFNDLSTDKRLKFTSAIALSESDDKNTSYQFYKKRDAIKKRSEALKAEEDAIQKVVDVTNNVKAIANEMAAKQIQMKVGETGPVEAEIKLPNKSVQALEANHAEIKLGDPELDEIEAKLNAEFEEELQKEFGLKGTALVSAQGTSLSSVEYILPTTKTAAKRLGPVADVVDAEVIHLGSLNHGNYSNDDTVLRIASQTSTAHTPFKRAMSIAASLLIVAGLGVAGFVGSYILDNKGFSLAHETASVASNAFETVRAKFSDDGGETVVATVNNETGPETVRFTFVENDPIKAPVTIEPDNDDVMVADIAGMPNNTETAAQDADVQETVQTAEIQVEEAASDAPVVSADDQVEPVQPQVAETQVDEAAPAQDDVVETAAQQPVAADPVETASLNDTTVEANGVDTQTVDPVVQPTETLTLNNADTLIPDFFAAQGMEVPADIQAKLNLMEQVDNERYDANRVFEIMTDLADHFKDKDQASATAAFEFAVTGYHMLAEGNYGRVSVKLAANALDATEWLPNQFGLDKNQPVQMVAAGKSAPRPTNS